MALATKEPRYAEAEHHLEAAFSAFGDRVSVPLTPLFQIAFDAPLNPRQWTTTVTGGGAVAVSDSCLDLQSTGVDTARVDSAMVKYRPGTALVARFTGLWPNYAGQDTALIGLGRGDPIDDGILFGIVSGVPTVRYVNRGAATDITQFNGSPELAASLDPEKGQIFMVSVPYLGYANVALSVYDPGSGEFVRLHTIYRANLAANTTFGSPSFRWVALTSGDAHVRSGSVMVGIQGPVKAGDLLWGDTVTVTVAAGTHYVYALRNASATSLIRLANLQIAVEGTKPVAFRLLDSGGTVAGGAWAAVHADSIAERNTTATGVGAPVWPALAGALAKSESRAVPMREYDVVVAPAHEVTVEVVTTANADVTVSLAWWEDP